MELRTFVHYFLHFGFPFFLAYGSDRKNRKKIYLTLLLTNLVDLDHLFATPIFDPNRCSIGFHPLHRLEVFPVYIGMLFFKKTRVIGVGLILHMLTDTMDCAWMNHGKVPSLSH